LLDSAARKCYTIYRKGDRSGEELRRGGTMGKRLTITWGVVAAAFLAAAPGRATIGSIISSFAIDANCEYGIHREGNYIFLSQREYNYNYLRTYTLSGSSVRRVQIDPGNRYALYSGSRTHLGGGYVALCDNSPRYLKIFSIARGGSPVASFSTGINPHNCFWNGEYYFVNNRYDKGLFRRYSRYGVAAGSWTCAGWPAAMNYCGGAAYAQRGNHGEGPYFVASASYAGRPCCITTFPAGSLVSTWHAPFGGSVWHLAYGDSSNPTTYGAAIWAIHLNLASVLEFDIDARGASGLLPASLGKVKAIYR
jgi:hypothetical protein